jgi:hypothetical protein
MKPMYCGSWDTTLFHLIRKSAYLTTTDMKKITTILLLISSLIGYSQAPTTPSTSFAKSMGLYVFPAKNQTKEMQAADDTECYKWAVEQSGVDPLNPTKVEAAQVETGPDGTAVRGAARGAAAGVAIGAIAGDAGKGAAIGAVAGGLAGRRAKRYGDAQQQEKNNQDAAKQEDAMTDSFKKAFSACLEGKGYTIK